VLKILLADDSMTAQNMGKKILTDAGYDVVTVSNGAAAVKKLPEVNPDIVLLDIYMPGYSGLEVCAMIKSDPQRAHIPVLLTVGKLEPFLPEDGMQVKAEGVVIKPFEATDLLAVVNRMAERIPPPAPEPVKPAAIPTIAIPDYDDFTPAPEPEPEPVPQSPAPWPDASRPAFDDDLLGAPQPAASTAAQDFPSWTQPEVKASAAAASPFGDFKIELEPLPPTPEHQVIEIPLNDFTAPEHSACDSGAALPINFELEEPAAEHLPEATQPFPSPEAVVDLAPFTPEVLAPEQVKADFEAAISSFQNDREDPALSNQPVQFSENEENIAQPSGTMEESCDAGIPDITPAGDVSADDLDRTLQEALAAVAGQDNVEAEALGGSTDLLESLAEIALPEHERDMPAPPALSRQQESPEFPIQNLHEPVVPDAMGTVINLDSILGEFSAPEEVTSAPVVDEAPVPVQVEPQAEAAGESQTPLSTMSEEQSTAEAEPPAITPVEFEIVPEDAIPLDEPASQPENTVQEEAPVIPENAVDANQVLAEQLAERVLQRIKPQLVEEIRNVLKEM
jgi:CheY-like chemotaxis protein